MKKRILFVDDEPKVLSGLRRMLRSQQQEWTTDFAEGGSQALAILETTPFDVVVSDMRMPEMNGVQLLEKVRERFPHMVRIILTGQYDKDSGLRALQIAHQMLNKPCDTELLKAVIARTAALSDLLANEKLRAIVTDKGSVPSMPTLYQEVMQELDSPQPAMDRVAAIIAKDMGMTAKIMHVVNSSFFGLRREITNPGQAVTLLGLETMKLLVLGVGIFSTFKLADSPGFSLEALQRHSYRTSGVARAIAKAEAAAPREAEHAAMAGLLHNVGKLVLLKSNEKEYSSLLAQALTADRPLWHLEREVFGASHAEIGACLLGLWGLPTPIIEAVAWHHEPSNCPSNMFSTLTAVHVASILTMTHERRYTPEVDRVYLERLNLLERLPAWTELAQRASHGEEKP